MINSKLHNPVIANNSHIENAVVQKVSTSEEVVFSDLNNATPVVPETGRIWYNAELGTFKFANNGVSGNEESYIDEFLSRTDIRQQSVKGKVNYEDTLNVFDIDGTLLLGVNSTSKTIAVEALSLTTKLTDTFTLISDNDDIKILADNSSDEFNINYGVIKTVGDTVKLMASTGIVISDGVTDKLNIDNINDSINATYATITATTSNIDFNTTNSLKITDGTNDKVVANNANDELAINYNNTTITGDATVDGNMVVTGDLTVGGQTSKVDIQSENLSIADNIITLNSNLTTEDPRLASAIVDGEDVDANAGISVNRGSEGIMDWIKWIESSDTTTDETLKEGRTYTSVWNYESTAPAYEMHKIVDEYTLARINADISGTSLVGYDGYIGSNIGSGVGFQLNADKLDNTVDAIVQEIDTNKFNTANAVRVGQTTTAGTTFTITHNLGTVFVNVKVQREEDDKWYFDTMPIEVVDENTIIIESSETTNIRYMIESIQGFDINQETDLVVS
jgi:sporulation protein YlmC with PRC-barrel domain